MKYYFYTPELLKQIPKVCGIYKITCLVNNKFYDGKAVNARERTRSHITESQSSSRPSYNMPIHKAFRKYGIENFVIEILEECKKEDLNKLEKYYIALHNSKDHNIGYNIADGGDGGRISTKITETQAYLIKELIPFGYSGSEIYSLFKEAYPDINFTERGLGNIYSGTRYSEVNKETLNVSDKDRLINRIKRAVGIDISEIITLISNGTPLINIYNKYVNLIPDKLLNYLLKYKEIPDDTRVGFSLCLQEEGIKVKGVNLVTGEIVVFNSMQSASIVMNICGSSISRCCSGSRRAAGGYKWEYIN